MSFIVKNTTQLDPGRYVRRTLTDSVTFSVGEVVTSYATGKAAKGAKLLPQLGVIVAFENADGTPIRPTQPTKSTTSFPGSVESVTTGSGNTIKAVICTQTDAIYSAAVNGTIGTTNTSGVGTSFIDVDSDNTNYARVLESTNVRTPATKSGFTVLGIDPEDSTRLLVSLRNSELSPINIT